MRKAFAVLVGLMSIALAGRAADLTSEQVRQALAVATPQAPADFVGKDLSDLDLSRLDFRHARLRGASLFASKLVASNFAEVDLQGANFNGAWLMGTNFAGANLRDASLLSVVVLGGEVKQMAAFTEATMAAVKMIGDLPGADLLGVDFQGAHRRQHQEPGHGADAHGSVEGESCGGQLQRRGRESLAHELLEPQGQQPARRQLPSLQARCGRPGGRRCVRCGLDRGRPGRNGAAGCEGAQASQGTVQSREP